MNCRGRRTKAGAPRREDDRARWLGVEYSIVIAMSGFRMNVRLDQANEDRIRARMESGSYEPASAVIGEALCLLEQPDRYLLLQKEEIGDKIAAGLRSLRAGRSEDGISVFQRLSDELDAVDRSDS